jgi:ATP-dependent phosphofructokinase / diphosphate-dependent phosphofructokinase
MDKKSLVYFQSGGPSPVINCSLYGVLAEALKHNDIIDGIYGSRYGVEGLIDDNLVDLRQEDLEDIELLKQTPGSALGSTRKKLPSDDDPLFNQVIKTIVKHNIGYILVNGGNDSMDTCFRLSRFFALKKMDIKVIGVPKTIDNDLEVTDHSIGFPSAARHVINFMKMAVVDAGVYKKGKVVLVEIMGRNAGWLTASVDILPEGERPDLIYVPEAKWDEEKFLKQLKGIYDKKGFAVCALSEGIAVEHHNHGVVDSFGHQNLEGVCLTLAQSIQEKLGFGTRVMELSLPQRADTILASDVDKQEAIAAGKKAVLAALAGETGKMVCLRRLSSKPYIIDYILAPVEEIANKEKKIPTSWCVDATRFSEEFRDYVRPLVQSETHIDYEDGVFMTAHLKLAKVQ